MFIVHICFYFMKKTYFNAMKAKIIILFNACGKRPNELLTCLSFTFFFHSLKIKSDFSAMKVKLIILFDAIGDISNKLLACLSFIFDILPQASTIISSIKIGFFSRKTNEFEL